MQMSWKPMGLAQNHQDWIIYLMKKIQKMETNVAENEKETEKKKREVAMTRHQAEGHEGPKLDQKERRWG